MLIVVAGSESVTTALVGTINYLLRNPVILKALTDEVRSTFAREKSITANAASQQSYLNAVLHEGLRLCPTIPDGMRRQIPKGATIIAGRFLPQGTVVSIPQWATYYPQPTSLSNPLRPRALATENTRLQIHWRPQRSYPTLFSRRT